MAKKPRILQTEDEVRGKVRAAFIDAIYEWRNEVSVDDIVEMLEAGNIDGVIAALFIEEEYVQPLAEELRRVYARGGQEELKAVPPLPDPRTGLKMRLRFSLGNPRAQAWLREQSSRLIREIIAPQRDMVRQVLFDRLGEGLNPRKTGLDLVGRLNRANRKREGGFIGLTETDAKAAEKARRDLASVSGQGDFLERKLRDKRYDRSIRKAMREGRTLPAEKQDQIVRLYKTRLLKLRADRIARTETIASLNAAAHEGMKQLVDRGLAASSNIRRTWDATGDRRTRPTHMDADMQEVGLDEPFIVGGVELMYPCDPNGPARETIMCRCIVQNHVGAGNGRQAR